MMALFSQVNMFLLMMLLFPRSDCCKGKGTGTTSTTLPPTISDPGEMIIVQHHSLLLTSLFQPCSSLEAGIMHCGQQKFIIQTETLPVSFLTFLTTALTTPRMAHWCVAAGLQTDPAGDGMQTRGPGTW